MGQEDYPPLSALNDLLYCPRRCALHRLEGVWTDNVHTIEGTRAHRRVDGGSDDDSDGVRTVRGLWVWSDRLRIAGIADAVEFRPEPYPVEYKRGKRRKWDNDDVQVCAQALCLEEMLQCDIPAGAVYHVRSRRRREVRFDAALRRKTEDAARRLHELLEVGVTPKAKVDARCKPCSVRGACLPALSADGDRYRRFALALFEIKGD